MTTSPLLEFKQEIQQAGVKFQPVVNKFYQRYIFKFKISEDYQGFSLSSILRGIHVNIRDDIETCNHRIEKFKSEIIISKKALLLHDNMYEFCEPYLSSKEIKIQGKNGPVTVYIDNLELARTFFKKFSSLIESSHGLISDKHASLLDENVVIRKTYYFKKYRYKLSVELPVDKEKFFETCQHMTAELDRLDEGTWNSRDMLNLKSYEHFDNSTQYRGWIYRRNESLYYRYSRYPLHIYFANEEDLVLFKLHFNEYASKSLTVVLEDELTE